jgi:hypothetical protein
MVEATARARKRATDAINPHGPWVYDDQRRCRAEVKVYDDHWGAYTNRCLLQMDHDGHHRNPMNACEPVAYLAWADPLVSDGTTQQGEGQ